MGVLVEFEPGHVPGFAFFGLEAWFPPGTEAGKDMFVKLCDCRQQSDL